VKVFCFIFIIHLVALLSVPCDDFFRDAPKNQSQIAMFDTSNDTETQSDGCSPLCICSCCGQSVASPVLSFGVTTEIENVAIITTPSEYSTPDTATYNNSVWQPPKA
jgi:hypothetical protein